MDIRSKIYQFFDTNRRNWLSKDAFIDCLDSLRISTEFNDQEMMTILKNFKSIDSNEVEQYLYHELVDAVSRAHYVKSVGSYNYKKDASELGLFLESLRIRETQWRK